MGVRRSWRILANGRFTNRFFSEPAAEISDWLLIRVWKLGGRRSLKLRFDFFEQPLQFDGLGIKIIATGGPGLLLVAGHGVSGQSYDGNALSGFIRFELACGFPAVHHRQ